MSSFVESYRDRLVGLMASLDLAKVEAVIKLLERAGDEERAIFVFGNGGSAATASHFVVNMVKGASLVRKKRFRIMALNDQVPTLTAYANDIGYDIVFEQPLRNFARPGDIVLAISGSGNSPNVLRAVEYANSIGCVTIGFSGFEGGHLAAIAQHSLVVPATHMGRIEDCHLLACHLIAYYFMEAGKSESASG